MANQESNRAVRAQTFREALETVEITLRLGADPIEELKRRIRLAEEEADNG